MRGAIPLITTDGFKFYERVIGRVLAESDDPTRLGLSGSPNDMFTPAGSNVWKITSSCSASSGLTEPSNSAVSLGRPRCNCRGGARRRARALLEARSRPAHCAVTAAPLN